MRHREMDYAGCVRRFALLLLFACSRPTPLPAERASSAGDASAVVTMTDANAPADVPIAVSRDAGADATAEPDPKAPLDAIDLHVDLAWQAHAGHLNLADGARQAGRAQLHQGQVGSILASLFVEKAYAMTPAEARREYEATFTDATRIFARDGAGVLGAPLGAAAAGTVRVRVSFEGADGFADDPDAAVAWVERGACVFALVHSRSNALGGASQETDPTRRARGLTAAGRTLAKRLLDAGAILDVSHASDATAADLAQLAEARKVPFVATHSGMRALHDIPRNVDDTLIKRIATSGGVVGVSFYVGHLVRGAQASLDDVVAHLEHLRDVGGTRVMALGSDFEGGIVPPRDAKTIAALPLLAERLRARGWPEGDVRAFFHDNAARVLGRCPAQ